ncbi:helix-turn-helix domain-containing protein [Microbacterium aquilitoris]|uniref:helix-turn-helix domain-containing protein n=1 Tax=Microbacterium aquilitoris TaxID=3067307 RepID=UPI00288D5170|nr:helix-turn-helix transcriptional regulator [Microbacterium sp. KSW2-22]MDT3345765.1 helix-turn-helix transcriptional regulator [Microbacterium sp. KSW2-22]
MTTDPTRVGPRLRAARQQRGWTLADLAQKAGMSISTLSRLEAGRRQASLELLLPLVSVLDLRLDDLVRGEPVDPRVRRATERRHGMVVAPLTLEHSPVQTYKIRYAAASAAPAPKVHDGVEWFYVLSGTIRLLLDGEEHRIGAGEAAEFDTGLPHSISATEDGFAEVVSIFSASGERIHVHGS